MNFKSIWAELEACRNFLGKYGYPAMDKTAIKLGLKPGWFTWVAAVSLFGTEPFTTAQLMRLFPYGLAQVNDECFISAVDQGYLSSESGIFRASEVGLETVRHIFSATDHSFALLQPLSDRQLQTLVGLLFSLAEAAFVMPEPPSHFILNHKRKLRELTTPTLICYIERYIGELQSYRDDMYIGTWQAHRIERHTWELLDILSQNSALTSEGIHEKLSGRGLAQDVCVADGKELIVRGWLEKCSEYYQITPIGKQARAEAEAETDRLFFLPWACLNMVELEELSHFAKQLNDKLKEKGYPP